MRKLSEKKKQISFINASSVNQVFLPTYNALKDPYLVGFFDSPSVRKHLKITGVLRKKRKLTHKAAEQFAFNESNFPLTGRPKTERTTRKNRSLSKSTKIPELRLPQVQLQQKVVQEKKEEVRKGSKSQKGKKIHSFEQSFKSNAQNI